MIKKRFWLIVFLLAFISYSGCSLFRSPSEGEMDMSFLTDEPCAPPCWHGIRLNESTIDDVYQVLDQLPFIQQGSVRERGGAWGGDDSARFIDYRCLYTKKNICGDIVISENLVRQIWFIVGFELTIEKAINKLGPPDYIVYIPGTGHTVSCDLSLYWVNDKISISNYKRKDCPAWKEQLEGVGIQVEREAKVQSISYGFKRGGQWSLIDEGGPYLHWPGFKD